VIGFGDSECTFEFFAVRHRVPRFVLPLTHPYSRCNQRGYLEKGVSRVISASQVQSMKSLVGIPQDILTRGRPRAMISPTLSFGSNILSANKTSGARLDKSYIGRVIGTREINIIVK
jgi:hypothetical protein